MPITFVGSATGTVINGGVLSITLSGIAGLAQNDVVVILASARAGTNAGVAGWTTVYLDSTEDTFGNPSVLIYKRMTASPDTSVSFWDVGTSGNSGAAIALAFRGVDLTTALDVTFVAATHSSATPAAGASPDPPAITPTNNNCAIVIFGHEVGGNAPDPTHGTVTNYTTVDVTVPAEDEMVSMSGGYRILTGGAGASENPGTWSLWAIDANSDNGGGAITIALRPAAGGTQQGITAAFSGAGALSSSVSAIEQIIGAFSGAGGLISSLSKFSGISATFTGAGALSASGFIRGVVSANFAGAGTLNASLLQNLGISATFGGQGLLVGQLESVGFKAINATFAGAGGLTGQLQAIMTASAVFSGAGALSSALSKVSVLSATFSGAGNLTAAGALRIGVSSSFNGAGTLVAALFNRSGISATFSGEGALSATLTGILRVSGTFAGAGLLSGVLVRSQGTTDISATFTGAGLLFANPTVGGFQDLNAVFNGNGVLSASLRGRFAVQAVFDGAGALSATLAARMGIQANFAGAGLLAADLTSPFVQQAISAVFTGAGSLFADLYLLRPTPEPVYEYPIGHGLYSDYGMRAAKTFHKRRLIIGRR